MSILKSRTFTVGLGALVIAYLFIDYFFTLPQVLKGFTSSLLNIGVVIAAFSMILAALNIATVHSKKIMRKNKGWLFSLYLIVLFVAVLIIGISSGTSAPIYTYIQKNIYTPVSQSAWSIMSVYYLAAVYHTFRARNIESALLVFGALIIILNNAPAISSSIPQVIPIASFFNEFITAPMRRAATIASGIGMVAIAIRVMLLIEKRFIVTSEEG